MTLGEKVKARREQIGMTQEELARKMGYKSKSSITKIEKGERDLPQSKIKQIADCLGTSPSYLMGWQREEPHIDMDMLHRAVEMAMKERIDQSEMTNLNITDVNFSTQEVKVLGKGNKERVVYLNDVAALHMRKYLASRSDSNDALFVGKGAVRLNNGGVRAMLKRIEKQTGVENIHPHRFRRTLATALINKGMAIQEVATILGHANINTTMTYIHVDSDNVKSSYKKLVS